MFKKASLNINARSVKKNIKLLLLISAFLAAQPAHAGWRAALNKVKNGIGSAFNSAASVAGNAASATGNAAANAANRVVNFVAPDDADELLQQQLVIQQVGPPLIEIIGADEVVVDQPIQPVQQQPIIQEPVRLQQPVLAHGQALQPFQPMRWWQDRWNQAGNAIQQRAADIVINRALQRGEQIIANPEQGQNFINAFSQAAQSPQVQQLGAAALAAAANLARAAVANPQIQQLGNQIREQVVQNAPAAINAAAGLAREVAANPAVQEQIQQGLNAAPDIIAQASANPQVAKVVSTIEQRLAGHNGPAQSFMSRMKESIVGSIMNSTRTMRWGLTTMGILGSVYIAHKLGVFNWFKRQFMGPSYAPASLSPDQAKLEAAIAKHEAFLATPSLSPAIYDRVSEQLAVLKAARSDEDCLATLKRQVGNLDMAFAD